MPSNRHAVQHVAPRRVPTRRCLALGVIAASIGVLLGVSPSAADPTRFAPPPDGWVGDPARIVRYERPVDGDVLRAYEPPTSAYGPGHRGVDLDALVGATVRAAADGVVAFAGPVAGTTWVSIAHPDGVTTSYGPIASPSVGRGDGVARGAPIGRLAAGGHGHGDSGLHWGARRGGIYLDPLSLLAGGVPRPSLVGEGAWRGTGHAVVGYEPWGGRRWLGATYHGSPPAQSPGYARPPNPNHLITIAGLGSSSTTTTIAPEHLGYDPSDVTAFSYAGRTDGIGDRHDPRRDQLPYRSSDTWDGVAGASLLLRDQLRAQQAREPGRPVDLLGHSLGGVVILHYLANHHDAYDRSLPPIGHVVTIASPLQGSDLAALGSDLRSHRVYGRALDLVHERLIRSQGTFGRHVGSMPLDAATVTDLRVGSPLLEDLAEQMEAARHRAEAGPLAMGTRMLTIGGGADVVVGPSRATLPPGPDLEHRVLPGGHGGVRDTQAVREVVWRFLADEEVVPSPGYLSTGVSATSGALSGYVGRQLGMNDAALAPLLPGRDEGS